MDLKVKEGVSSARAQYQDSASIIIVIIIMLFSYLLFSYTE